MPRIATNTTVDIDNLLTFVRPRHRGVLLTIRGDGTPQASPVTCGVGGDGRIVVSTYPQRVKAVNVRRTQNASIVILSEEFDDAWVQVDGSADVIDAPESVEPLVDYFRSISGEHPDWDEYREAMIRQNKSIIRITPTRWGPIATGGFPPAD